MIVEVVLFIDVLGETCDDKSHIETRYFSAGYKFLSIEFFTEGDGFFEGGVESHIDAGFLFNVLFHLW